MLKKSVIKNGATETQTVNAEVLQGSIDGQFIYFDLVLFIEFTALGNYDQ